MLFIPIFILVAWLTFVFFCALMQLRAVRNAGRLKQFNRMAYAFAVLTLIVGAAMDFTLNIMASIPLAELPQYQLKEWTLSRRMRRLKNSTGQSALERYRRHNAEWVCAKVLTPIDPTHCG